MVKILQLTIPAGQKIQVSSTKIYAKQVFIQNNASNAMRVGDSGVTATTGIALASGSPGGSMTIGADTRSFTCVDLSQLYVFGTAADVVDVLYVE